MRGLPYLELARPTQWIKNGFVLMPLFFAHALFDAVALRGAVLATLAFCLCSSAVYAFNDWRDRERDRQHPDKCQRPLARGALEPVQALRFAAVLVLAGLGLALTAGMAAAAVIALYLVLQAAYSLGLKRIAWLDVVMVASGFALRIVAGGLAAQVPLTDWILSLGFLLALLLALGKRHADLVKPEARASLAARYDLRAIEWVLGALGLAILACYGLYTISPEVVARHGHRALAYSTPFVALGILRYGFLVFRRGAGGDPSRLALRDPVLLLASSGWLLSLGLILYR